MNQIISSCLGDQEKGVAFFIERKGRDEEEFINYKCGVLLADAFARPKRILCFSL